MSDDTIRFDDGAAYEIMMGCWSILVGARFLDWLGVPDGSRRLDAGDGPLTISAWANAVCGVKP